MCSPPPEPSVGADRFAARCGQRASWMITLMMIVNAIDRMSEVTKHPGMNRTCVRLPGRFVKRNSARA
jgi:hypothetical protein